MVCSPLSVRYGAIETTAAVIIIINTATLKGVKSVGCCHVAASGDGSAEMLGCLKIHFAVAYVCFYTWHSSLLKTIEQVSKPGE